MTIQTKPRRFSKLLANIIQLVLFFVLIVVSVVSFSNKLPIISSWGIQALAVSSGSMEPTIPVGSLIIINKPASALTENTIITYKAPNDESGQTLVTHRISQVKHESDTYYVTKGDANNTEDAYQVTPESVIGAYAFHVPLVGFISSFAQTPTGFMLLILLPGLCLLIWEIVSLIQQFQNNKSKQDKAEIARLKAELAAVKEIHHSEE